MKNLYVLLLMLLGFTSMAVAQCSNNFYIMEKGATYEMTFYNKKDKVEGRVLNAVMEVDNQGEAQQATLHSKFFDKKDKVLSEGDYQVICEGDKIKIDVKSMLASMQQFSAHENMNMKVEGDYIIFPSDLEVGASLPESKSNMTLLMGENNATMSSTDIYLKNRKVEKEENVTTPAGTFKCYKIVYDMDMDMKVMGINRKMSSRGAEWIAEGVGVVKTASYDKKGEIESYSLLSSYQ